MAAAALSALAKWDAIEAACPFCRQPLSACEGKCEVESKSPLTRENSSPIPSSSPPAVGNACANSVHGHMMYCFSLAKYQAAVDAEIQASKPTASVPTAPPEKTRDRAMAAMRSLVSQKKIRFQQDGFDLDLTYITPRIIAMGFPSHGRESYFRNPIDEVERFFEQRHAKRFRIYNLCSERDYEGPGRFGGRYKRFPFDDHNAPCPIKLIPDMCRDMNEFLQEDEENVVAIHCKAGKGRTGVMVSCLLMLVDPGLRSPTDALAFFGDVRTADGKGVTIPSQKRYVAYWDMILRHHQGRDPPVRIMYLQSFKIHSLIRPSGGGPEIYFNVYEKGKLKFESKKLFSGPGKSHIVHGDAYLFEFSRDNPLMQMTGDVKFVVYQQNRVLKDEELFHFWLNMSLCAEVEKIPKMQLDKACKDKKHSDLCADLAVTVTFVAGAVQQKDNAAGDGAGANKKAGIFGRLFK